MTNEEVLRIFEAARYHKNRAEYHRRRARTLMQDLERVCLEFGIELNIHTERNFHSGNEQRIITQS